MNILLILAIILAFFCFEKLGRVFRGKHGLVFYSFFSRHTSCTPSMPLNTVGTTPTSV